MRLIDADALKLYIDKEVEEDKVLDGWAFFFKTYLDDAPTIDMAGPQGEWLLLEPRYSIEQKVYWNKEQALADTKGNGALEKRKCSCCGYTKQFSGYMKDKAFKLWLFCPNCGAQMKGADDE